MERRLRPGRARPVVFGCLVLLSACGKGETEGPAADPPPPAPAASKSSAAPSAKSEAPASEGELFQSAVTAQSPSDGPSIGGGYVYWLRKGDVGKEGLGKDRVQRRRLTGGDVEDVAGPASIFDVDADAERVYWLQKGGELWSRPHDGAEATKLAQIKDAPIRLVLGKEHLLLRGSGGLTIVARSGGAAASVSTDREMGRSSVVADGDRFFVLTSKAGEQPGQRLGTVTVFTPGAGPKELATGIENPGRLLGVHGAHLYLSAQGTLPVTPRLVRIDATSGGAVEPIGEASWGFGEATIDGGVLYGAMFVGQWGVFKLPLSGGAPVRIGSFKDGMPEGFASSDDAVYWVHVRDLYRAKRN